MAAMADIKEMFHQVKMPLRDCDSLRFLWWPDGNLEAFPEEFQMVVHLLGATSFSSVCGYAFQRVAIDKETKSPRLRKPCLILVQGILRVGIGYTAQLFLLIGGTQ